jgi:hypothetical protein
MKLFLFNLLFSVILGFIYQFVWNDTLTIATVINIILWFIYLVSISDPDHHSGPFDGFK